MPWFRWKNKKKQQDAPDGALTEIPAAPAEPEAAEQSVTAATTATGAEGQRYSTPLAVTVPFVDIVQVAFLRVAGVRAAGCAPRRAAFDSSAASGVRSALCSRSRLWITWS